MVDRAGIPLAVEVTAANLHDSHMLAPMLDAIPPLKTGRRGRPRRRPASTGSRARGSSRRRTWAVIAGWWNGPSRGSRARYRRLTIRYERLVAMHRALLHLGCALICFNSLLRM